MSIAENIKELRSIFDVTQKELARVAGVTENAVSKWENGYAEPRMGAIERMASCYGLSKMHIIEDGGMSLVDPVTKRPRIPRAAGAVPAQGMKMAPVPLLGRVHAGKPVEPDEFDGETADVPAFLLDEDPDTYALTAEGDCMNKVYPEGCIIAVSPNRHPQNGSVAVVTIDGTETVMRRMYRTPDTLVLSPDSFNAEHRDIVITSGDGRTVEFGGKVVWFQASKEME